MHHVSYARFLSRLTPPGPRLRPLHPSAAPRPGGRVRRVSADRPVPDRRRLHGGGGKHAGPDRPAGPEEGAGVWLPEGAVRGGAGPAVPPLPAGGGVLRSRPLPPHPQSGGPAAAAQSLPEVPPQLPPSGQPGAGGRGGGASRGAG